MPQKEVPTGTVDGANKTFSVAFEIDQIDDVWVDGVIYTGNITIRDTQIQLADAPTDTIFVDYNP